jgi:uncharacterized iron-regulated membrane protein
MKSFRTVVFRTHLACGAAAGLVIFVTSVTGVALTCEKQLLEWAGVTLRANPRAPATVTLDGNAALLVNPYTGAIIGEPPAALRSFFRTMTVWHRYIALEGASRITRRRAA